MPGDLLHDRPASFDPRRLRADDLRYLLAVSHTGRLVNAAEVLGVDHTTVSRRISALEKAVGVRLFEREVDGWTLTEMGRAAAKCAQQVDDAINRVAEVISGVDADYLHGTVRLITPDAFGVTYATPALARLRRKHQGLAVELVTATRQLASQQAGFDIAVTVGNLSSSRLASEKLGDYSLGLYASQQYLAQHPLPRSINDLRQHTLISYVDSLLQIGDLDFSRYLPGIQPEFTSTNVFAHVEATVVGAGIGVLPVFLARKRHSLVHVLPGRFNVQLSYLLAARRDNVNSAVVQEVRNVLRYEVSSRSSEMTI